MAIGDYIAYYKFDEELKDETLNYPLILSSSNNTKVEDRNGYLGAYTTNNSFYYNNTIRDNLTLLGNATVSFGVKIPSTYSLYDRLLYIGKPAAVSSCRMLTLNGGSLMYNTWGHGYILCSLSGYLDKWIYVTFIYENGGSDVKLYIDNVLIKKLTGISTNSVTDFSLFIGGDSYKSVNANMCFDEVRIYDRSLTIGEIDELYDVVGSPTVTSPSYNYDGFPTWKWDTQVVL